jgi:hypothetical protein
MSSLNRYWLSRIGVGVHFDTRLPFMLLCACFGVWACKGTQIVWSAEAASPDGKFVANARTSANSGFGIDGIPATFVYLNWAAGSQKPMEIMEFANESDPSNVGKVAIKWLSPRHLEIAYDKGGAGN